MCFLKIYFRFYTFVVQKNYNVLYQYTHYPIPSFVRKYFRKYTYHI